jgi:hypothetical protein
LEPERLTDAPFVDVCCSGESVCFGGSNNNSNRTANNKNKNKTSSSSNNCNRHYRKLHGWKSTAHQHHRQRRHGKFPQILKTSQKIIHFTAKQLFLASRSVAVLSVATAESKTFPWVDRVVGISFERKQPHLHQVGASFFVFVVLMLRVSPQYLTLEVQQDCNKGGGDAMRFSFRFPAATIYNANTNQSKKYPGRRGRSEMIKRKTMEFERLGCIIITKWQKTD